MGNKQPRKMISCTMNLIMTVLGFAVSATFIVFVCARLACAGLRRRQARVRSGSGFEMDIASIERSLHGMEPTTVASFPTIKYNQDTLSSREDTLCTVCLGEYEEKEVLRVLPLCGHAFHLECIDAWLRQHATCPICRISLRNSPDRHQISIAILRRFGPGAFPDSFFHHANWSEGMFSHPVMDDAHQGTVLPHLLRDFSNRSGGSPVHGQVLDTNMARLARSSSLETITELSGRWSFGFRKRWDREEAHVARRGREETPDDFLAININIERDIDNPSHLSALSPELQASDNCDSYSDNAVSLSSNVNSNVEGSSQTVPGRHVTDVDEKKLNTLPGSSGGGTKRFLV